MATTHNAHSDLIHLFIDGEATETERNILFGALKDSPELQEEFSSAMQLKQAFASDISKLQPPSYLESQIAERAGLIVAATSSLATAPIVVNSLSNSITSALSSTAPIAATGISKGLMTLLIGTAVGVLSTIGIVQLTSNQSPKNTDGRSSVVDSRSSNPGSSSPVAGNGSSNLGSQSPAAKTPENLSQAIEPHPSTIGQPLALRSAAPLPVLQFSKASLIEKSKVPAEPKEIANTVINDKTPARSETVKDINNNNMPSPVAAENIAAESLMPPIASAEPMIPVVKNVGTYSPNHSALYDGSDGFFAEPDWMARVSVRFRYMPAAKLYQGQIDNEHTPAWNNMGWGLKYELDPFNAVALEGGVETFPVFLAAKGGGFTGYNSIAWGGASYTYSFAYAEVFGIHPEVRGLAGVSTAGPIAKISAGLVFEPYRQIGFSIDPEYTALFIKEAGVVAAGSKIGLTASMIVHF